MRKRVMIVEDNELNMKLFNDLLENEGHETILIRDGDRVQERVREEMPDLVIMDIQLPQVSGLDLTKNLKDDAQVAHIPVIAVTAFAMKGDEDKIRRGGCDAYLSKPISVVKFLETVNAYLAG